ncbi:DUF2892 domain-containing protein [Candidatus Bipolaricaulota bacterium]|nr:DUF2892 domain-containing protein [Candidatus Bipolaricaulota bacterium]
MKRNVGDLDSRIRSRLGLILILVGILGLVGLLQVSLTVNVILIIVGAISFATGSTRRCGVYSVFGIDTSENE